MTLVWFSGLGAVRCGHFGGGDLSELREASQRGPGVEDEGRAR
jgi:hypothetical protein